jgi:hypothetical protein
VNDGPIDSRLCRWPHVRKCDRHQAIFAGDRGGEVFP